MLRAPHKCSRTEAGPERIGWRNLESGMLRGARGAFRDSVRNSEITRKLSHILLLY